MRYLLIVLLFLSCQKDDLILPKQVETKIEPKVTVVPYKYKPIVDTTVTQYLSTPASGSKLIIPVVIIDIIPTDTNGVLLESVRNSFPSFGNKIVSDLDKNDIFNWCLNNNEKTKFAIEEGSKFRGYDNPNEVPYVGIKVVKYFKVQDLPIVEKYYAGKKVKTPDYFKLFESIDLKNLVESVGVKEVWLNYPSYVDSFYVFESNMSSPYGDISNSYRDADLPVYNKTYVLYGNATSRWFAEMMHCRGHQIEAQLGYVDNQFFWKKFVGSRGEGRCGDTHNTPNSTYTYDYDNSVSVLSDITDWNPNGGKKVAVNKTNWRRSLVNPQITTNKTKSHQHWNSLIDNTIAYDPQSGWLLYWFQSIPSNKTITFGNNTVTNWWDIFYNWDDAMKNKKKLYN